MLRGVSGELIDFQSVARALYGAFLLFGGIWQI